MKSFREYTSSDVVTEAPTGKLIKRMMANTVQKKKYDAALKVLRDIWTRKSKEKPGRHGLPYYASGVANQYNIDTRVLVGIAKKAGL
jgi:hypothetical protein